MSTDICACQQSPNFNMHAWNRFFCQEHSAIPHRGQHQKPTEPFKDILRDKKEQQDYLTVHQVSSIFKIISCRSQQNSFNLGTDRWDSAEIWG